MDSQLIDVLVCPLCKGKLFKRPQDGALLCKADKLAFPVRESIPVMLVEQAQPLDEETPSPAK
ncbi:MAG: Trm112 family protein [Limnobacter sp.]|nr:Trm112 family protein [Limnobacter sp.]